MTASDRDQSQQDREAFANWHKEHGCVDAFIQVWQAALEYERGKIASGNAAIKGDYSDWDSVVPKAEALLNSEGRAGT